ncbi:GUN4 domain-containing protein [Crocosphaera sp. Alani8]|uniref:GUN4 domain-containing protein n=1 Tax=Crocosphaera sp. Alani8 TaxID=3038952 RepID=UPI00313C8880
MSNPFGQYIIPVLAILINIHAPHSLALSAKEISRTAKKITVLIEGPGSNGTGLIINKSGQTYSLFTAAHVVGNINPGEEAYVVTPDQKRHLINTRTIEIIPGVDLAVVEFNSDRIYPTAKLANGSQLTEGSTVYVSGFPLPTTAINASIYTFVPGKITATGGLRDGYGLVYTNNTLPGMSGGPVLNQQGEVVGIHGRADTTSTQTTGYDNIYIKTGLNLGVPLTPNLIAKVKAAPTPPLSPPPSPTIIVDPVQPSSSTLVSQTTGVDYTALQKLLKAQNWQKADQITYDLLSKAGDQDNSGFVTSTEYKDISCEDLQTIDRLWLESSQGRFGLSVQQRIYKGLGGSQQVDINNYRNFAQQVGWVKRDNPNDPDYYLYDDLDFSLNAPPGHLPRWSWGLNIAVVYSRMPYLTPRLSECQLL